MSPLLAWIEGGRLRYARFLDDYFYSRRQNFMKLFNINTSKIHVPLIREIGENKLGTQKQANFFFLFSSVQSLSRVRLCDPMDCSMPGLSVHYQFLELTQMHVHWVGDAIKSSHPLLSPSSPTFNLSQHQGLFKWVSSLHQVAKLLVFQLPVNIHDWFPLGWTGWIFLLSKGLSRIFSNTTVQKHQFFGAQLSL